MKKMLIAFVGAAALIVAAPVARAQVQQSGDSWSWRGTIAQGRTLEIRGISGSIRAEPASSGTVEVTAVKRGSASDRADVRIEMVQEDGGVTICAVYSGTGNNCRSGGGRMHTHDNDADVDFVARVPAGVAFEGAMVSGDVQSNGVNGHVSVTSVSGDVLVRNARAEVTARSVSGSVTLDGVDGEEVGATTVSGDVEFTGPVREGGRYRFGSVSGDLTLRVDGALNATVSVSTVSGELESDFPVTLTRGGRFASRRFEFTVGGGGTRLTLSTVSGGVQLRRGGLVGREEE